MSVSIAFERFLVFALPPQTDQQSTVSAMEGVGDLTPAQLVDFLKGSCSDVKQETLDLIISKFLQTLVDNCSLFVLSLFHIGNTSFFCCRE